MGKDSEEDRIKTGRDETKTMRQIGEATNESNISEVSHLRSETRSVQRLKGEEMVCKTRCLRGV
jgi:hypothetical protein